MPRRLPCPTLAAVLVKQEREGHLQDALCPAQGSLASPTSHSAEACGPEEGD